MTHMRIYTSVAVKTFAAVCLSVFCVSLTGCVRRVASLHTDAPVTLGVVEGFVAAFNRADVEGMIALSHPDLEWLSIEGAGIAVEARGTEALREAMTGYFASDAIRRPRSTLEAALATGPWVTVQERMTWQTAKGEQRSQVALAVYQLEGERVRRVYYFPSERSEPPAPVPVPGEP